MKNNPFAKSRKIDEPYAVYTGFGPFGETETRVLRTYKTPDKEVKDVFATWLLAVKSEDISDKFEVGHTFVREAIFKMKLVRCCGLWAKAYPDHVTKETITEKP
jgi:hypothetical protein